MERVWTDKTIEQAKALYERIEGWMQSDCAPETSRVLSRLTEYFPQPKQTGPDESEHNDHTT